MYYCIFQVFREARRTSPSIVYLPHLNQWWNIIGDTVRSTIVTLIHDLDPSSPVLLLATCEERYDDLDFSVSLIFMVLFPLHISFYFKEYNTC